MRPGAEAVWGCGHEATSPNAVIETRHTGSRPSAHDDEAKPASTQGALNLCSPQLSCLRQARNCIERCLA